MVLGKFYTVADKLKKERIANQKNEGGNKEEIAQISSSGRNILGILLNTTHVNQRTVASMMNISAQAVSENMKKLEQGGYIIRKEGMLNNENLIVLTEEGREIAVELDGRIRSHAEAVLANMTDTEVEVLYQLLDKMLSES